MGATKPKATLPKLENWREITAGSAVRTVGGNVYNHPSTQDGKWIVTSAITTSGQLTEGMTIQTLNRKYLLGKKAPALP